jgi:uncharacterized ParB-like nuclease family protein
MSVHINDMKRGESTFTHVHSDGSKVTTFAVSRMLKSLPYKLVPVDRVKISAQLATRIMESGVINRDRLHQKMAVIDPVPVTFLRGVEGFTSIILVDGAHRYCAHLATGTEHIMAKIVPMSVWSKFVVTGLPETVQGMDDLRAAIARKQTGAPNV